MEVTVLAAAPDRVVRRVMSPDGVVTTSFDGKRHLGRRRAQHGRRERPQARRGEANEPVRLRDWREGSTAVRVAGKGRVDGEEVWVLRVDREFEPPVTRYVSTASGLLKKEEGWITAGGIGTVPISIRFDDYREVAGVKLPFRSTSESALTGKAELSGHGSEGQSRDQRESLHAPRGMSRSVCSTRFFARLPGLSFMKRRVVCVGFRTRVAASALGQLDPAQILHVRAIVQITGMASGRVANDQPDRSALFDAQAPEPSL